MWKLIFEKLDFQNWKDPSETFSFAVSKYPQLTAAGCNFLTEVFFEQFLRSISDLNLIQIFFKN